jgi:negative regulator of flagellin synthesis FlgM
MSMTIDRVGPIDPIQPGKRPEKTGQVHDSPKSDSVSISSEAHERAELLRTQELAAAAQDVRPERVAELKEKINDPSYINESVITNTANKLIDALFG